jgi:hypothetical protein
MEATLADVLAAPVPTPALSRRVQGVLLHGLGLGLSGFEWQISYDFI